MTPRNAIRPWCALAQYPGKRRFRVGTITMPAALTSSMLPEGFEIIEPLCGALVFQDYNDD